MTYTYKSMGLGSFFGMSDDYPNDLAEFEPYKNLICIVWNNQQKSAQLAIDGILFQLEPNQIITTTYLQKVSFGRSNPSLVAFAFNREFYCINDHDHEVSCNGIIFLGTQEPPIVTLDGEETKKFDLLLQVFKDEFYTRDNIQGEMLQMLLKRLIIKTTRLAKEQLIPKDLKESQIDTIRKFNVLVDLHYKKKRHVADYAEMLFKSPKTLSNLFAKYNQRTPLQIIHERIVLEAKRLLIYSEKSAKQIAFELGFEETGSFHKLFKKITKQTPQEFKQNHSTQPLSA